ncbi:MAG TPA: glycosyl hydrolase family 18 protein, partial [Mobilitalea sp.]|nr:glycosyl hydrolase family 18 protein [Mobilitalea sp.]
LVKKFTPSNDIMELTDYYKVKDSEVLLILQDQINDKKGLLIDGEVYVDYDTVVQKFNHRFYWDNNENILTYTTPTEILQAEVGTNKYTVMKSTIETSSKADYQIVKVFGDKVYVALDFVKQYSDITAKLYNKPDRVIIDYKWGDYLFTDVTKDTQLRTEASIKSPILLRLKSGMTLMYVDTEAPKNGFSKVMTEDGIVGYVKAGNVKKSYYKTLSNSNYKAPEYTAQTRPGKINLVFHQVFNQDANSHMEALMKDTKGVTVISPTWFSVKDVSGTISSLANESYVTKAKDLGMEVWALADDFNTDVNMYDLLSHTSSRENLSNALIEEALRYKLNGINIDFEKITADAGSHYIEFLRELSVKCRNNGIVLSVDSYVPSAYTEYYDREEQGKIIDYVVVMAYDEYHGGSDQAGPVASIGFVKDAVNNILTMVPKEKTIIAIPFYSRLWKEAANGKLSAESFGMNQAETVLKENGATAQFDPKVGCNYAEYKKDGATYQMWEEEDKSIDEKMKVIYDADVAGTAAWKLGLEKSSVWNVIVRYLNE